MPIHSASVQDETQDRPPTTPGGRRLAPPTAPGTLGGRRAPPTTPGKLGRPVDLSATRVVGALMVVAGIGYFVGAIVFSLICWTEMRWSLVNPAFQSMTPRFFAIQIAHMLVAALGVWGGVRLQQMHPRSRRVLVWWVWLKLIFAIAGGYLTYFLIEATTGQAMVLAPLLIGALGPPLALLLWLRNEGVRRQMAEWKAG